MIWKGTTVRVRTIGVGIAILGAAAMQVDAAIYRVVPAQVDAPAGDTLVFTAEVETEAGDNTIGNGYLSFAIDLTVSGSTGAAGGSVHGVTVNQQAFPLSNLLGSAVGQQYRGVGGVVNFVGPRIGAVAGQVVDLFDFNLTVPLSAIDGDTILIMPGESPPRNLVNVTGFPPVSVQAFEGVLINVVPEPATSLLMLSALGVGAMVRRRR